jgi:hypothetical protein
VLVSIKSKSTGTSNTTTSKKDLAGAHLEGVWIRRLIFCMGHIRYCMQIRRIKYELIVKSIV